MEEDPRTYVVTVTDARDIDGDPYEASSQAFVNLDSILLAAQDALEAAHVLACNAALQRDHDSGRQMSAVDWEASVPHKRLIGVAGDLGQMRRQLDVLKRAVTFNPKGRLDEAQ